MVVYGDLLFLINFSMDFLCFYLSCLLLHRKLPTARAFAASCIGGAYSVLALFLKVGGVFAFAIDAAVLFLMCLCVYYSRGCKAFGIIKAALLYFLVSALLGGVMTSLFSLFNELDILEEGFGTDEGVEVWVFAFLAVVGAAFTARGGRIFRSSAKREVELELVGEEGISHLRALVDSGNLATEPISGRAVIFASAESCREALGEEMCTSLSTFSTDSVCTSVMSKIRLVPSKSVTGEGLFPALRFKDVRLKKGREVKYLDVYIAFVGAGSFGEYDAIISDEAIV